MLLILLFVALLLPVSTVSYVGAEGNVENRLASAERLIKWISDDESNVVNNVKVQIDGSGNLGLYASTHCAAEEYFIRLSKRFILTEEMFPDRFRERAQLTAALHEKGLGHERKHVMLLYTLLLDHQNQSSHFRPYYDMLPASLSHLPLYWTHEELRELGPVGSARFIHKQLAVHNALLDDVVLLLAEVDPALAATVSRRQVLYFWCIILSRSFQLPGPGELLALIPLGDIFNHNSKDRNIILVESQDHNHFRILADGVQAGAELLVTYGNKSNHMALFYYGFVPQEAAGPGLGVDSAQAAVQVLFEDPTAQGPLGATADRNLYWLHLEVAEQVRAQAMALLRELVLHKKLVGGEGGEGDVVLGRQVEKKMLLRLAKMCQYHLQQFPTSLAADLELLRGAAHLSAPQSARNLRNAILHRVGEKQVLAHYLSLATAALRLLAAPSPAAARQQMELCRRDCHAMALAYCSHTVLPMLPLAWQQHLVD